MCKISQHFGDSQNTKSLLSKAYEKTFFSVSACVYERNQGRNLHCIFDKTNNLLIINLVHIINITRSSSEGWCFSFLFFTMPSINNNKNFFIFYNC